jgi:hypothetical protein
VSGTFWTIKAFFHFLMAHSLYTTTPTQQAVTSEYTS